MHYKKYTLRNGLRVIFAPMADVESATVMIMTGTGSRYENKEENGMAHFLEHMFFKGTQKRPSAQDISHELDAVGGVYNAFTGKDRTAYYAKVPAQHAECAVDVVSDIFLHATLKQREITKERGAILQEINMYEDMPSRDVYHVLDEVMFGDHPLGRAILGPKDNVKKFKRSDFLRYLERCYTSKNTVICVAGKFSQSKILAKIRRDFRHMRSGDAPQYEDFIDVQKGPRVRIKEKQTDQTHFIIGMTLFGSRDKRRYALAVLTAILSGGSSSRLFMEIREKRGLAYSVYATTEMHKDIGEFIVKAGVEHENLSDAIKVSLRELKKMKNIVIKDSELQKAKEYIKGSTVLGLETSDDIAEYLIGQEVRHGKIKVPAQIHQKIDAVTAQDIRSVAQDIFRKERLNLAIIGPHAGREKELQELLVV